MALAGRAGEPAVPVPRRTGSRPASPPNTPYRVSDLELASRLSFFLWSSIPDDELLNAAIAGKLHDPAVLERQVRRMLADAAIARARRPTSPRSGCTCAISTSITPDMRLFPDFDDNLRQAFRQETELFFDSVLREDRSVLDLLRANYTFVNERLAKHYGIPHVYGSQFRRDHARRGQRARRTAAPGKHPDGHLVCDADVARRSRQVGPGQPARRAAPAAAARRAGAQGQHGGRQSRRSASGWPSTGATPTCAGCHNLMDPIGLSLEKFDAVGRRRTVEGGVPIDASGGLPDGSTFADVDGLEAALLRRPELFVGAFTEKLLTYASGRGVEYYDAPAIRAIVRDARAQDYRISSIILGVVKSAAVSDEDVTMIITKKALPRRTFLRGLGASVALPLLDAMVPSMTALAKTAADPVRRLGFVYMPMGCDLPRWTPPATATAGSIELSPTLQSLEPGRRSAHGHQQPGVEERLSRARTPRPTRRS